MSSPIRITFRENADHFSEGMAQASDHGATLVPRKVWYSFCAILIVGAVSFALVEEHRKGMPTRVVLIAGPAFLLMLAFLFWLFSKLGFAKYTATYEYKITDTDKERWRKSYRKLTGREERQITCEFEESGFRLTPEQEMPGVHLWSSVPRVAERPKGLLIYTRNLAFFWFPKAAFATDDEYRLLLDLVASKVQRFERLEIQSMVFVALGSNMGDSVSILNEAIAGLREYSSRALIKSSFWQSTPVDCPPGSPLFVNAVVGLVPKEGATPERLLAKLQALEREAGRRPKKVLNEPRPLDLDLIAWGTETPQTPTLTLPHPRAHLRRFVLEPLNEIAPDLVLPGQTLKVSELLAGLRTDEVLTRLVE